MLFHHEEQREGKENGNTNSVDGGVLLAKIAPLIFDGRIPGYFHIENNGGQ